MGRDADILYTDDQFAYSGRVGGFVPHSMWVNIPSANDLLSDICGEGLNASRNV